METCFRMSDIAHDSDEPLLFLLFPKKALPSLISDASMLLDEYRDRRGKIAICPLGFKNNDWKALYNLFSIMSCLLSS